MAVLAGAAFMASCSDSDDPEPTNPATIAVGNITINFDELSGEATVTTTNTTAAWTVGTTTYEGTETGWITSATKDGNKLKIVTAKNETEESRVAKITVKVEDKTATCTVTQLAEGQFIATWTLDYEIEDPISFDGATGTIGVTTNIPVADWDVEFVPAEGDGDWMTVAKNTEGTEVSYIVEANEGAELNGKIVFTSTHFEGQEFETEIEVRQAEFSYTLAVTPATTEAAPHMFSASSYTKATFTVETNTTDWAHEILTGDWFDVVKNGNALEVTPKSDNASETVAREGTIKVSSEQADDEVIIYVGQRVKEQVITLTYVRRASVFPAEGAFALQLHTAAGAPASGFFVYGFIEPFEGNTFKLANGTYTVSNTGDVNTLTPFDPSDGTGSCGFDLLAEGGFNDYAAVDGDVLEVEGNVYTFRIANNGSPKVYSYTGDIEWEGLAEAPVNYNATGVDSDGTNLNWSTTITKSTSNGAEYYSIDEWHGTEPAAPAMMINGQLYQNDTNLYHFFWSGLLIKQNVTISTSAGQLSGSMAQFLCADIDGDLLPLFEGTVGAYAEEITKTGDNYEWDGEVTLSSGGVSTDYNTYLTLMFVENGSTDPSYFVSDAVRMMRLTKATRSTFYQPSYAAKQDIIKTNRNQKVNLNRNVELSVAKNFVNR